MRRIFALFACLLTTTLAAQKESATIGQFLDAQGAPVAAAKVTFATSPLGVYDSFAPATLHKVPTDENGRFRVMLQSNRSYSAWATGPRTAAGYARSKVMEGVIAGSVLTINATTTKDLLQLRIAEVQRLGTGGPFTALIRLDARHGPELSLPSLRPAPSHCRHWRMRTCTCAFSMQTATCGSVRPAAWAVPST